MLHNTFETRRPPRGLFGLIVCHALQAGTVRAMGNTICQIGQIGGPFVGVAIRRITGVWWPHFAAMGALNIVSAMMFAKWGDVVPPPARLEDMVKPPHDAPRSAAKTKQ